MLTNVPFNSAQWAFASIAVGFFGYKNYISYKRSKTYLSSLFTDFSVILAVSLGLYGWPGFVTDNPEALLRTYIMADFFLYASMVVQARILWYMGLKSRIKFGVIATIVIVLAAIGEYGSLVNGRIEVLEHFIEYHTPVYTYIIRGIVLGGLLVPTGYLFIREGLSRSSFRTKFKSIALGAAYFGVGLATVYRDTVMGGLDNLPYVIINSILFGIFFLAMAARSTEEANV